MGSASSGRNHSAPDSQDEIHIPGVVEASIEETLAKVKEGTAEAMAIRKSVSDIGGRK